MKLSISDEIQLELNSIAEELDTLSDRARLVWDKIEYGPELETLDDNKILNALTNSKQLIEIIAELFPRP